MINKDLFNKFKYDLWAVRVGTEWQSKQFLKYCIENGIPDAKNVPPWESPNNYYVYNAFGDNEILEVGKSCFKDLRVTNYMTWLELNTEFISADKFLKQNDKIQRALFHNKGYGPDEIVLVTEKTPEVQTLNIARRENIRMTCDSVPLLNAKSLTQIIENITKVKINAILEDNQYTIYILDRKIRTETDNLTQALWKVACKVAEES